MEAASLSPRLASLVADNAELQDALLLNKCLTTQELATAGSDAEDAARRLGLSLPGQEAFVSIFAFVREKANIRTDERMKQMLDVVNESGELIMRRPRCEVLSKGFRYRAVNVWALCPKTGRVLIGQRAVAKDMDPDKWTCVCCRVPSGELSMNVAAEQLSQEFGIEVALDTHMSLAFSLKTEREITRGLFSGHVDKTMTDVYVATLDEEVPLQLVHLDVRVMRAAKYVEVADLEKALVEKDSSFVTPPSEEYSRKLIQFMRRMCREVGAVAKPSA
ncbi:unnamed protein product [Prorocentrum cordatum]|uniref:Nudix hydrolase domain-containing protein n=1 Tax=Prorocentrum cordatum TaxID=2364126 RepID=A0ABN9PM07_9DINO|nr:unnamed protein product [Polarella glacialis]